MDLCGLFAQQVQVAFKEVQIMAKCAICEKAAHFGNAVSHSHRRSNKMWKANVKSVKVKVNGGAQTVSYTHLDVYKRQTMYPPTMIISP